MGPVDFLAHLLGFTAPAFFMALAMALCARLFRLDRAAGRRWWVTAALNFAAGLAVLVAGLLFFGNDGKMATYAVLVVAVATSQWLAGRGWAR